MKNLHLTILKDQGGVGAGATVTVYDAGTENISTIYSDDGVTPKSNPFTVDSYGRGNFYAANGSYDINVSGTGITEYRLYGIKLFDIKAVDEISADTDKDKAVSNNLAKNWEAKIPLAQKGAANGVAELGADSKVPSAQLPAIAITDTHVAANEAAQLALTVQKGDVCVRSDQNKSYVALNSDNASMADWQELLTPTDLVLSVNGKTGAISLNLDDIGEGTTYKRVTATKEAQIHVQGTDQKLDEGGANEVTVANVKSAVDLKHSQSHTLASHSTKPHSALTGVTADQHHNEKHDTDKHTNLEYDSASSSGLDFYYKAGRVRNDNAITNVVAGHVTLADDDISYVEVDKSGVITDNITGFTSGKIPLYQVTTATGAITEVLDKRTWLSCINVPAAPIPFKIGWAPGDTYNQHFHIRVGTGNGAEGGTYIIDKESKDNQADWIHFSPDTVIQIPADGIDYLHHGFLAQYTVGEGILTKGINYNIWKRVWDVTAEVYGDWDWLGSIIK